MQMRASWTGLRPSARFLGRIIDRAPSNTLQAAPLSTSSPLSCSGHSEQALTKAAFRVLKPAGGGGAILRTAVYAVLQLGPAQYKVSAGDLIYTERLKGVDVGAELALQHVYAAGSLTETLVGRPYLSGASVTAVVEEQVQDGKVISFKKRRRKNSRRTIGHRQYLTGLRVMDIQGINTHSEVLAQEVVA